MKFQWIGKRARINSDLLMCKMESILKALVNSLAKGSEGFLIEYRSASQNIEPKGVIDNSRLNPLIQEYKNLFQKLTRLPPKKGCDHVI